MEGSSSKEGGIQLLLAAEQEAQKIVSAARAGTICCSFCCFCVLIEGLAEKQALCQCKQRRLLDWGRQRKRQRKKLQHTVHNGRRSLRRKRQGYVKPHCSVAIQFAKTHWCAEVVRGWYVQTSGDSEATVKRLEEQTTAKIEQLSKEASDVAKDVSLSRQRCDGLTLLPDVVIFLTTPVF